LTMPVSTLLLLLSGTTEQGVRRNCEQEGKMAWRLGNEPGTSILSLGC